MRKWHQALFIACFFIILCAPVAVLLTNLAPRAVELGENRNLAQKPDLKSLYYDKWPVELTKYISDNIGYRSQFIRKYIQIWDDVLASHVRLFYKGTEEEFYIIENNVVERYLGLYPFPLTKEGVFLFKAKLAGLQAFCEEHGALFICLLAPEKPSVYPEYLSSIIRQPVGDSWQKLYSRMLERTPINFLDMTDVLIRHKKEYKTFNKIFDLVHWNGYGLYLAYRAVCEALSPKMPLLKTSRSGEYYEIVNRRLNTVLGEDTVPWMYLLKTDSLQVVSNDIPAFPSFPWAAPDVVFNNQTLGGAMLCFGDSYFSYVTHLSMLLHSNGSIMPFAHHFKYFIKLHNNDSTFSTAKYVVEKYKPTVVVYEFAERGGSSVLARLKESLKFVQMGEVYLQSPRFVFYPDLWEQMTPRGMTSAVNERDELVLFVRGQESHIELPSVETGEEGRVVLLGTLESPETTQAHVRYSQPGGEIKNEHIALNKGSNDIYVQLFCEPNATINVKFYPGDTKGEYKFLPLPELKRIEQNSQDEEYLKNRFLLDKEMIANAYFPISELKTSADLRAEGARQ